MKHFKWLTLSLLVTSLAMFSCKDQEETGTCSDGLKNQGEAGVDCGGPCSSCPEGAQGTWKSYPVAPILANFADSLIAEFKTNNTYVVDNWKGGTKTTLTGTYTQQRSTTGSIWTITVNQTSPTTLTSEGIFEIYENDTKMRYEIVQTTPAIGANPPTPAAGFGSSTFNGTPLGAANIQQYVRVR